MVFIDSGTKHFYRTVAQNHLKTKREKNLTNSNIMDDYAAPKNDL